MTSPIHNIPEQKAPRPSAGQRGEREDLVAEAANVANDHFLATISHELRTPLSAMLLWTKLLEDEYDSSPERMREGVEAIRKCAEEMQELIDDLLDTSRIVAGKMRLELKPANLRSAVQLAVNAVRGSATAKNITIEERIDPGVGWVVADARRLQQLVSNLLSNSVKFTPAGGRIGVETLRRGESVEIRVTDSGIGINPEFIERIFDRSGRADQSAPGESNGLGLGLSICKRLVELHGGKISAESPGTGQGATFVVSMPWRAIDPAAAPVASVYRSA